MSRTMSRTASGLAALSLALGCSLLSTPAAWAGSLEGTSSTYSYTCDDQAGSASETMNIEVYVAAPAEAEVGQEVEFQVEPNDYNYYSYTDEEVSSGTLSADVTLSGEAAPSLTATASTESEGAFGSNNEETFDESALRGTFTPTAPGEVTLAPADITIDVEQPSGSSSTICSPDSATDALATVNVTGEPMETEAPAGGDSPAAGDGTDAPTTGAQDEGSSQALLIGGAVTGGLLVIVGIAMLGFMVYFMRRRS